MTGAFLQGFDGSGIGPALIDRDLVRKAVLPHRFFEKAERGFLITMRSEQEVDRLAVPVDGAVVVFPPAFILMYVSSIRQLLPTGRFFPLRKAASSCGVNFWTQ